MAMNCDCIKLQSERIDLRRDGVTVYSYNMYIFSTYFRFRLWIIKYIQGIFCYFLELNYYLHGSNILLCDIFNVYKLYKVKARESSSRCYSLRERVGIEGRVVSGSHLIYCSIFFKDLINVKRSL